MASRPQHCEKTSVPPSDGPFFRHIIARTLPQFRSGATFGAVGALKREGGHD